MKRVLRYGLRYGLAAAWIAATAIGHKQPVVRVVMSYLGGVVGLAHAGAAAGAMLQARLATPSRDGMNMPILGLGAGLLVGAVVGGALGYAATKNLFVYYAVNAIAVAFIVWMPLV